MSIKKEITRITQLYGRAPNNIGLFAEPYKSMLLGIKLKFKNLFKYQPSLSECYYIVEHKLTAPMMCKKSGCTNHARFGNRRKEYEYCSKKCSDTDDNRNKVIQAKRIPKIDYSIVHSKTVGTKNKIGIDGLTTHQRASNKAMKQRNANYASWYAKVIAGVQNRTQESRAESAEKRARTLQERYGVTHFGGGYSSYKKVRISGTIFLCQGYEHVAIYDLIHNRGILPNQITACSKLKVHQFTYLDIYGKQRKYNPDLFIQHLNLYIEVKSVYWAQKDININKKKEAIISRGFTYERITYDYRDAIIKTARKNIISENR